METRRPESRLHWTWFYETEDVGVDFDYPSRIPKEICRLVDDAYPTTYLVDVCKWFETEEAAMVGLYKALVEYARQRMEVLT